MENSTDLGFDCSLRSSLILVCTVGSGFRGFDTQPGHILSFVLPLIQGGWLSVTSQSMCTMYWLTA